MKICAVIVTFNRLEKLRNALQSYEEQSCPPHSIIVVNNNSTDGTYEFLCSWEDETSNIAEKYVIHLHNNTGGAGGFHTGIEQALKTDADWIWVSDDDAYPEQDALMKVQHYAEAHSHDTACICGAVYINGNIDIDHRRYNKNRIIQIPCRLATEHYKKSDVKIDETSFVGSCFKKSAVIKAGLPIKDFFIYFDDTEFSHRISHHGKIMLVPDIKITHDTVTYAQPTNVIATWRDYYLTRNHVYTLRQHHFLSFLAYCAKKTTNALTTYIRKRNVSQLKMNCYAILHGITGHLGLHHKYKPGYNITVK